MNIFQKEGPKEKKPFGLGILIREKHNKEIICKTP